MIVMTAIFTWSMASCAAFFAPPRATSSRLLAFGKFGSSFSTCSKPAIAALAGWLLVHQAWQGTPDAGRAALLLATLLLAACVPPGAGSGSGPTRAVPRPKAEASPDAELANGSRVARDAVVTMVAVAVIRYALWYFFVAPKQGQPVTFERTKGVLWAGLVNLHYLQQRATGRIKRKMLVAIVNSGSPTSDSALI